MNITIITKDEMKTKIMQCCDIFENFKVVLGPSGTIEIAADNNKEIISKLIEKKGTDVIAIFDDNGSGWIDDNVKTISDGQHWSLLLDFVKKLGYKDNEKSLL